MSATCHEYKMELTDNVHSFFQRTGIIVNGDELEWLGLNSYSFTATFLESVVHMIVDFCKNNPEYHIITVTSPGHMENRYVPGKRVYYLAKGDKNPNLALNPFVGENAELFTEKVMDTALAIISDINRSNKARNN